jgi:hypothetical protein
MLLVFVDLTGSTAFLDHYEAESVGVQAVRIRMAELEQAMLAVPEVRRVGARVGDQWVFVAPDDLTADVLRAVFRVQAVPDALLARFALGLGGFTWHGPAFGAESNIDGRIVNLTARLLDPCPPSGIAMTQDYYLSLNRAPILQRGFSPRVEDFKGIDAPVRYWLHPALSMVVAAGDALPAPSYSVNEVLSRLTAISDRVDDHAKSTRYEQGRLAQQISENQRLLTDLEQRLTAGMGVQIAALLRQLTEQEAALGRQFTQVAVRVDTALATTTRQRWTRVALSLLLWGGSVGLWWWWWTR